MLGEVEINKSSGSDPNATFNPFLNRNAPFTGRIWPTIDRRLRGVALSTAATAAAASAYIPMPPGSIVSDP